MPIPTSKIALVTAKKVSVFLPSIGLSGYLYNEHRKNSDEYGPAWHANASGSVSQSRPVKIRTPSCSSFGECANEGRGSS